MLPAQARAQLVLLNAPVQVDTMTACRAAVSTQNGADLEQGGAACVRRDAVDQRLWHRNTQFSLMSASCPGDRIAMLQSRHTGEMYFKVDMPPHLEVLLLQRIVHACGAEMDMRRCAYITSRTTSIAPRRHRRYADMAASPCSTQSTRRLDSGVCGSSILTFMPAAAAKLSHTCRQPF